eukprot:PhM_4_TR15022/c0_g1_i1/m.6937
MDTSSIGHSLDRVQALTRLLEERDGEIDRLRGENHDLCDQLRDAHSTIDGLVRRAGQLEGLAKGLSDELTRVCDEDVAARCSEIERVVSVNERLHKRVANLQDHLDEMLWQMKGVYPYLGLQVSYGGGGASSASGVSIVRMRDPALRSGLREHDVIKRIRVEKEYPVVSVENFQRCVAELLPECNVHVTVDRSGDVLEYVVRPALSAAVGTNTSNNNNGNNNNNNNNNNKSSTNEDDGCTLFRSGPIRVE